MKKVTREEVRKAPEYAAVRDDFRRAVLEQKDKRRIHVGSYLTFLFENHDTVLYQIQEMIRAENITKEPEIRHEMETYNELLGERGELGCTLLIEIDDPARRAELLARWKDLPGSVYVETQNGVRIPAEFDPRQVGEGRISSVHYLKFRIGDQVPRKVGCSHPEVAAEAVLTPEQTAALCQDLM
ncbi:MAG TPA: DUF3501 family protein [Terriglobia bacterium]|nr:DUF3501 family protein [Terriglobia bacterium]